MIFIGLDVSKISTALCIEKDDQLELYSYTTKKANNIWIKNTSDYINYRFISYNYTNESDYSKSELLKLDEFNSITDLIINDIYNNITNDKIKIGIEGYSYNSKGPIFDLIEFTTILKYKIINLLKNYSSIEIISPLTLKSECCKMVYQPRIEYKGKKIIKQILHYENNKGKQATKFDKWDMFNAFIDSDLNMNLKEWCKEHEKEINKGKEVPKPLDDLVDAIWLKEIKKQGEIK
jgi:hypothetical protein